MPNPPLYTEKDTVFTHLFSDPKYQLELYQALHPEETDVTEQDITDITLERVVTNHVYNDLAFAVRGRFMVFVEAQSKWSINVLWRMLDYFIQIINMLIQRQDFDIHGTVPFRAPIPEFYVIFTGERGAPDYVDLNRDLYNGMSDFINIRAKVITDVSSDIIGQYIGFCRVFNEQKALYGAQYTTVTETIRICREQGYLVDFLKQQEYEVATIMDSTMRQEMAINALIATKMREATEAATRAAAQAAAQTRLEDAKHVATNLVRLGMSFEDIAAVIEYDEADVRKWFS